MKKGGLESRDIADAVRSAARMRQQPGPGELQLLVQAFLQPDVLESAWAWQVSSLLGGIKQLSRLPGWQGGVSNEAWQQLLDTQRLLSEQQAGGCEKAD